MTDRKLAELNDGRLQALIVVEMHLDALRRQAEANLPIRAVELERIQSLLREATVEVAHLLAEAKMAGPEVQQNFGLTPRELEILSIVATDCTDGQTAELLNLTQRGSPTLSWQHLQEARRCYPRGADAVRGADASILDIVKYDMDNGPCADGRKYNMRGRLYWILLGGASFWIAPIERTF